MTKRTPLPKETCLQMAKFYADTNNPRAQEMMWQYLFCWGFYDMWIEGWWQE